MYETLILSIAAAEAAALVTTRRLWRAAAFAVLITAVVVHAALVLGLPALACALPALFGAAWFVWAEADARAAGIVVRWAVAVAVIAVLTPTEAGIMPLFSDESTLFAQEAARPLEASFAAVFLLTVPANRLVAAVLQCARGGGGEPLRAHRGAQPGGVCGTGPADVLETGPADVLEADGGASAPAARRGLSGGRWIGPLERLLIVLMAASGPEAAIAAIIAAKGVIRFPEVSKDDTGEKAEEFLIGSLVSWGLAVAAAVFITSIAQGAWPAPAEPVSGM
ncbi:hypothetical protein HMPREF1317_2037 [Schaalia georgiae F0490]|uniref:Uncharacterized protein n=1 Tax=Schaalia georgiae F0490 TaxID=1125717 RepID=J0NBC4_9ACTO|nr:hypothetical protein [Schaalia georgiae]EJF41937.1 hypothetical protein HMPREF1317_2037 [Schaalia georgiae F0490]